MNMNDFSKTFGLTHNAVNVGRLALEKAFAYEHNYVGVEHFLLAIIDVKEGLGWKVLAKSCDLNLIAAQVSRALGVGTDVGSTTPQALPLTSRLASVIGCAEAESKKMTHTYIGTEHLLLGILREGGSPSAQILVQNGLTLEKARAMVLRELEPTKVEAESAGEKVDEGSTTDVDRPPLEKVVEMVLEDTRLPHEVRLSMLNSLADGQLDSFRDKLALIVHCAIRRLNSRELLDVAVTCLRSWTLKGGMGRITTVLEATWRGDNLSDRERSRVGYVLQQLTGAEFLNRPVKCDFRDQQNFC